MRVHKCIRNTEMRLFDDKIREDLKPARHLDNLYVFFDRSGRESSKVIRELLNDWFYRFPQSEKLELKSRIKLDFSSTFYELFIHELFTKLGYKLTPHPTLVNSTDKPDFLAQKEDEEFYIEAKVASDITDKENSNNNRYNSLLDTINTTNSPDYFLSLKEVKFKKDVQPKGKKIVNFIEQELMNLPMEDYNDINSETFEKPRIEFEDEILKLSICLIPKSDELRGKTGIRPIGIYNSNGPTWGGADDSIKSAFKKKAKKYGRLDKPFILCINALSEKQVDEIDVFNAFFGSEQFTLSNNPNDKAEKFSRAFDGLFLDKNGPKYTKVSGILVTKAYSTNLENSPHWFIEHPFAKFPITLDLQKVVVKESKITTLAGRSIKEVLNIPEGWLTNK